MPGHLSSEYPGLQLVLRRAFIRYGLPQRISLDHDNVFYDNACALPYPTCQHGFIERIHQMATQQAVAGQTFDDDSALQKNLSGRLDFLNLRFPSRSLGGQTRYIFGAQTWYILTRLMTVFLVAYPEAQHSERPYRLEWEESLLDMQRVYTYLAQERWFRRTSSQGQFSLDTYRYGVGKNLADQTLEITFDPQTHELVCLSEDGGQETPLPVQGLIKSDLMDELDPLLALLAYQLASPFSPSAWREMMLRNDLTGMIL